MAIRQMKHFSPETYDPTMHGWVGFDLDGSIAHDEPGASWSGNSIGEPIPEMIALIKAYLAKGAEVRILTARASTYSTDSIRAVKLWTEKHIGQQLEVTASKDYDMWCLYDDRAITVERNTGRILVNYESQEKQD